MDRPHPDQQGCAYEAGTPGPWPPPSAGKVPSGPGRNRQGGGRAGDLLARHAVDRLGRIGKCQLCEGDQVAVHLERVQINVLEGVPDPGMPNQLFGSQYESLTRESDNIKVLWA